MRRALVGEGGAMAGDGRDRRTSQRWPWRGREGEMAGGGGKFDPVVVRSRSGEEGERHMRKGIWLCLDLKERGKQRVLVRGRERNGGVRSSLHMR